jgi:alpha-galactosidase
MKEKPLSRREFMRIGAGAAALGAGTAAASGGDVALRRPDPKSEQAPDRAHGTEAEMQMAEDFLRAFNAPSGAAARASTKLFPARLKPPFSFVHGGGKSSELLTAWKVESKPLDRVGTKQHHEITYTDPATGLVARVEATTFSDFPAVEWVIHLKNNGNADTSILNDIQALDCTLCSPDADPVIHYAKGATCSMEDFRPMMRTLGTRGALRLQPGGGRSSSDFLPFFNVESRGEGVVLALGWTGEWAANFRRPEEGTDFQVRAGMALTHLKLHPGEEIRTPRVLALFWKGERLRGNNLLRQFILTHHRPVSGGKPVNAPLANHNWGSTSAADHLENVRQIIAHDLPMDYYWIDAEWFGDGPWWMNPGNWEVKKDVYPEGLRPISDLLHSSGRKFLLWFEPERVCEGTPWATQHREWLLEVPQERKSYRGFDGKGDWDVPMSDPRWVPNESVRNQIRENDRLFNLALPEARKFLTDFISSRIEEFGIDCFRNDANIAPLEFWRAADAADRQGMTEIRWVEGLYAFWDELLRRHPRLMIDDCASGGRRIDLETIGRSMPLTRTDFVGNILAGQCHSYGLNLWVPLQTTTSGNLGAQTDYNLRSSMTAGLAFGLFSRGDAPQGKADYQHFPFAEVRRSLEQFRSIQKYFYGDYYPLTEYTQANDAWMAYQLDLPAEGEGLVVVLKRPESSFRQATFRLHGLASTGAYEVEDLDGKTVRSIPAARLREPGLEVNLMKSPDTALIRYRRRS